ncbi:permease [Anaerocolumna sp. AGMB13025]|uniref:permease n=1 Tax=Anaerocolumna sp. AGMB13025 TaxID=3039116 RepID=UPI00241F7857|nr:permease [Anaerocolumna sp. AGMB13025]WFR54709.1 permease [Anaerocolumna sp. AGMB13025]
MKKILKKYSFLLIVLGINIITLAGSPQIGKQSFLFTTKNLFNFLFMLTPVFICIGLLDVWVEKETIIKIMGEKSGIKGVLIAFLLGVSTAVPLYALLPVAAMMLKKGSKITNVLIFICSSASIRIPLLLFEISSLGLKFTFVRFAVNIVVVLSIAFLIDFVLSEKDKISIFENAENLLGHTPELK